MLPAVLASVRHRLVIFALSYADQTTVTAHRLITPTLTLKELARRLFIRKLAEELKCGESFRLGIRHDAGPFCNMRNLTSR